MAFLLLFLRIRGKVGHKRPIPDIRAIRIIHARKPNRNSGVFVQEKLKIEFPSQGWQQILTARREMLDAYDRAREQARSHEVETYHGNVAEAVCRRWLADFLPKRYGVTSGYVVSPGLSSRDKTPHFDVIIYDQLESPILWIEDNPDSSSQGRSLAIPVEYVRAILEVKAAFSAKTVRDSLDHLRDLSLLLQHVDDPADRYKIHLPSTFCCGSIFFELRQSEANSEAALLALIGGVGLRGYFGGVILRGEGHTLPYTGRLSLYTSETPIERMFRSSEMPLLDLAISKSEQLNDNVHFGSGLKWAEYEFAQFAFDLIAMIQGTYSVGRLSSFYGMGYSIGHMR
jgi:hypothetical protein